MPVQQHPVPQHIASYEFRLVGDMTLRQFGYLASGTVIALIFYGTALPTFIKWPLIVFSGFLGFAFAFMPIGERPLSIWILAFIKAIISPSQFVWQKTSQKPDFFAPRSAQKALEKFSPPPPDKTQLTQYLQTLPTGETKSSLDQQEENFLKQIGQLFQLTGILTAAGSPTTSFAPTAPKPPPRWEIPVFKPSLVTEKTAPKEPKSVVLPEKPGKLRGPAVAAKTSAQLPLPAPPNRPNILAGMVLDKNGEIIEGAIIEIRDSQGMPVRALKTNKLGQFTIATPLEDGIYEIETEKEGYQFGIIKIETKGEIIQPLEIRAK